MNSIKIDMSFEDVAKGVIKKSIRSAVCIDDQYASAYNKEEGLEFEEPAKLYNSFREIGQCDLDIYQFRNLKESWKTDYMLYNKDLMILDWELDAGGGSDSTLIILKDVIDSDRIPFILIYTSTSDLHLVAKSLIRNFNYTDPDLLEDFHEEVNKQFSYISKSGETIDSEIFLEENESLLLDYILHYDRRDEVMSQLIYNLNKEFLIEEKYQEKSKEKLQSICVKMLNVFEDPFLDLGMSLFNTNELDNKYITTRIEISPLAFKINGTSIIIYHKEKEASGIKPENLFSEFADAVINNPHNFLTLLSLEFKDRLREDFSIIGSDFSQVDEKAFFYHLSNYRKEENGEFDLKYIYDFILKSWINELHHQKMNEDSEVLSILSERYNGLKDAIIINDQNQDENTVKELVRYSAFISTSNIVNRTDSSLRFGDIFINQDKVEEFFLCITPSCDCLRPDEKIKNNFYFIRGYKHVDYEALKEAETGFVSFLRLADNTVSSINWRCKPFTSYVDNNNINSLSFNFCGDRVRLKHVALLKENYAQRIANQSFGYGYRIGIDLPHISLQSD